MEVKKGRIELDTGPMFSGKTSELVTKVRKHTHGKKRKKVIILKWDKDKRGCETNKNGKTHDNQEFKCMRIPNILTKLQSSRKIIVPELLDLIIKYDVIGLDDGHFFQKKDDLVTFCEILANKYKKIVFVAALDGNWKREPFEEVLKLVPKCDFVHKHQAVCYECSGSASFTFKHSGNKTRIIDIGNEDKYMPLCRKCYLEKSK